MKLSVACLAVALVIVGAAAAARGDPQKKFTPADQARAKAMLLRKADFIQEFRASKPSDDEFDFYCGALDESDLVLTGEAESLDFGLEGEDLYLSASSGAQIYRTAAQSAESWRRGTSAAGLECAELGFRRLAKQIGAKFVSLRQIAFPRLASQTVAYRTTMSVRSIPLIVDLVVVRDGRAQSGLYFASVPSAYPRFEEVRLSRIVAGRMAEAMRGT